MTEVGDDRYTGTDQGILGVKEVDFTLFIDKISQLQFSSLLHILQFWLQIVHHSYLP